MTPPCLPGESLHTWTLGKGKGEVGRTEALALPLGLSHSTPSSAQLPALDGGPQKSPGVGVWSGGKLERLGVSRLGKGMWWEPERCKQPPGVAFPAWGPHLLQPADLLSPDPPISTLR